MKNPMYEREIISRLRSRVAEERRFIQVLAGPRQVGKTTLAKQLLTGLKMPSHYASADDPALRGSGWLEQQWNQARMLCRSDAKQPGQALFVLDEVQKISSWSDVIKKLWDEDSFEELPLKVILLGSSPLLIQKGLTESLAGRFEVIQVPHWSFSEMNAAFGFGLDQYIFFGGYPGSGALIDDEERWRSYVRESLIETTISRDVLLLTRVDKPALLRRLFDLGCTYSAQILSYQKMIGQLQDAGNTTTLAHYLDLLNKAGLLAGLNKYAGQTVRKRASSPKLQVYNTALLSSGLEGSFTSTRETPELWGRLVESSIGAHLLNSRLASDFQVCYWRDRNREVDFVLEKGDATVAIEVKSGLRKQRLSGMEEFGEQFGSVKKFLVGEGGIGIGEFLEMDLVELF